MDGLTFSLTARQEIEFDAWLVEQNKEIVEKQIKNTDSTLTEGEVAVLEKLLESGTPIPHHDGKYGYYSISFTPTDFGNRIYVHNHITNESFRLYDPSMEETPCGVSETEVVSDVINEEDIVSMPYE
jgi:hypothetical protein